MWSVRASPAGLCLIGEVSWPQQQQHNGATPETRRRLELPAPARLGKRDFLPARWASSRISSSYSSSGNGKGSSNSNNNWTSLGLGGCRAKLATGEKEASATTTTKLWPPPSSPSFNEDYTRFSKRSTDLVAVPTYPGSRLKRRVIVIAGPTAVGKTRLSIELAKMLDGEIINADSVQVYRGLDIGAAKISMEEREGIEHHLMDLVPPTVEYTYEQFLRDSRNATEKILKKKKVPIVVGGTGMYMRWYMQNRAVTCHPFDGELTNTTYGLGDGEWDYDFQCYFLYQHRADLYPRVDYRCELMVPDLLEEASSLLNIGLQPRSNSAARAIGYEEAMELLLEARMAGGIISEDRFLAFLTEYQHHSKGLVRKQISWFRNSSRSEVRRFRWISAGEPLERMVSTIQREYKRSNGMPVASWDADLKDSSYKEQKRMKSYKPTFKIYSRKEEIARVLEWIRRTQNFTRSRSSSCCNIISINSNSNRNSNMCNAHAGA